MQITMAAIEELQKRLARFDKRLAHLNDEITHCYERHGHTNRDWAIAEQELVRARRDELLAAARIMGIDIRIQPMMTIAEALADPQRFVDGMEEL